MMTEMKIDINKKELLYYKTYKVENYTIYHLYFKGGEWDFEEINSKNYSEINFY